jgi:glycosyltransferase involved in cell wall biosynthesis
VRDPPKKHDLLLFCAAKNWLAPGAKMGVCVFPSKTDTFGNAGLKALAFGVAALVTDQGGPHCIVQAGETGYVCRDNTSFVDCIKRLTQPARHCGAKSE